MKGQGFATRVNSACLLRLACVCLWGGGSAEMFIIHVADIFMQGVSHAEGLREST